MEELFKSIKNELMQKIYNLNDKYDLYSHATIRSIIVERDKIYKNVLSAILLEPAGAEKIRFKKEIINPSELIYFEGSLEIEQLDKILDDLLSKEEFNLEGLNIKMHVDENQNCQWYNRHSSTSNESKNRYGISYGLSRYYINTPNKWYSLQINLQPMEIFGLDRFDRIVWKYVFNRKDLPHQHYSTREDCGIYILIPNYHGEIEKVEIVDKKIRAYINNMNDLIPLSDLSLTFEISKSDLTTLATIIIDPLENKVIEKEIDKEMESVQAFLWWNKGSSEIDFFIDKKHGERPVYVEMALLEAHKLFDDGFEILEKTFESSKDKRFEWSIATLMHLCGFKVEWLGFLGEKLKQSEIDILAFLPNRLSLIAIECTTAPGNIQSKIQKLHLKIDDLEKRLIDYQITGAIFTNRESDNIPSGLIETAGEHGIAIITLEKIKEIFKLAKKATPTTGIEREISNAVHFDENWL